MTTTDSIYEPSLIPLSEKRPFLLNGVRGDRKVTFPFKIVQHEQEVIDPFFWAAGCGDVELVRQALAAGADPNERLASVENDTPLIWAANSGSAETVEVLLEAGADVGACSTAGVTALMHACARGNNHTVSLLLNAGASFLDYDKQGLPPLFYCFKCHSDGTLNLLLARVQCQNQRDRFHFRSAVMWAAAIGFGSIVEKLISSKADIHRRSTVDGATALHFAASHSDGGLRQLITAGADVNARNRFGAPPIELAIIANRPDNVRLLADAGADVKTPSSGRRLTPLMLAAQLPDPACTEVLLGTAAMETLDVRDSQGNTALMHSSIAGVTGPMTLLLDAGADKFVRNHKGQTALDLSGGSAAVRRSRMRSIRKQPKPRCAKKH